MHNDNGLTTNESMPWCTSEFIIGPCQQRDARRISNV